MSNPILPGILVFKFFDPTTETSTGSKHVKPDIFGKHEVHSTKRTQLESENHWFRHWPMRRQSQKGKSCFLRKTFFCSTFNKVWCEVAKPKASSIFPVVLPQRPQTLVATTCKMSFHKVFPTQEVNCEGNKSNVHFIKLHAPWPLLCRFVQLQQSNL